MSTERDNQMVWDYRPGHYEVWYTTLSHLATRTGFWIRYTLSAPAPGRGEPYAQLWFARFDPAAPESNFGIHHRHDLTAFQTTPAPFSVAIAGATQRHDGIRGALAGAGHEVSWDLSWRPAERVHHHLPALFYRGSLGDTKVLSPNLDVVVHGTIQVDGRRYEFSGDPAGQTHLWGRKHAYQWAWSHCNAFDGGRRAVFESISARLKRGALILPRMTVFTLHLDGEILEFNQPWRVPLNRSHYQTGFYQIAGAGPEVRVEAALRCRPDDTILAEYIDPDGDAAFCHNCCAADLTLKVKRRSPFVGRWRDAEELTATRTAHWEWGARAGDAAQVKRWHTLILGPNGGNPVMASPRGA